MSEHKNVTIGFHKFQTVAEESMSDIRELIYQMATTPYNHGNFDGKNSELTFKVHDVIETGTSKLFLVSIIKERAFLPVQFSKENGEIKEPELNPDSMGDIAYYLICPDNMSVLTLGGRAQMAADFLRWLSGDYALSVSPIFIGNVYDQVIQWEIFRKVNIALEAPATDFVDKIMQSEAGQYCGMLEALEGLKIDITVSLGHGRGSLNKKAVRAFIDSMTSEDVPTEKLKVCGKSFEEQATAEYDLYNAMLKHKTEVVVAGTHISPDEAKSVLYEAYQLHLDDIEAGVEEEDGDE